MILFKAFFRKHSILSITLFTKSKHTIILIPRRVSTLSARNARNHDPRRSPSNKAPRTDAVIAVQKERARIGGVKEETGERP